MGIRKIGIMELMMCTVKPMSTKRPIVQMTLIMATIMGAATTEKRRKKSSMSKKTRSHVRGADTAICRNISLPKVSSATGRPAMWGAETTDGGDLALDARRHAVGVLLGLERHVQRHGTAVGRGDLVAQDARAGEKSMKAISTGGGS